MRCGGDVKRHARLSHAKSMDLYLARMETVLRIQVQCDAMDNVMSYGFWAVGSLAILGAALAYLVW